VQPVEALFSRASGLVKQSEFLGSAAACCHVVEGKPYLAGSRRTEFVSGACGFVQLQASANEIRYGKPNHGSDSVDEHVDDR